MRRIRMRVRRPSAPLVISAIALFVALSGTSGASTNIVALAKRALTADKAKVATTAKVANTAKNALKVNGQTAAAVAATPGPADTLNGMTAQQIIAAAQSGGSLADRIHVRTTGWSEDQPDRNVDWYAACLPGETVVGGGWDETQGIAVFQFNRPTTHNGLSAWRVQTRINEDAGAPAHGSIYAVCVG
jgi:hypothetical protein